jgi:hypothetical protein
MPLKYFVMKEVAILFLLQAGFAFGLTAQNPSASYRFHPQPIHEKPDKES